MSFLSHEISAQSLLHYRWQVGLEEETKEIKTQGTPQHMLSLGSEHSRTVTLLKHTLTIKSGRRSQRDKSTRHTTANIGLDGLGLKKGRKNRKDTMVLPEIFTSIILRL